MKPLHKTLIVGTIVSASLMACQHQRHENKFERISEKISHELDLNAEQQKQLERVKKEVVSTRELMHQEVGDPEQKLLTLFSSSKLDREGLQSLMQAHARILEQRSPNIVTALGDFYDSLDNKQQAEIREFVEEHHAEHGKHHH